MPDNTNEVNLNFKATGLNDVDRAKQTLKGYRDEVEKAKTAGDATAQALNEQLAKLAQKTVAQELGKQFGQLAAETGDTANAIKGLNEELQKLSLSEKDIAVAGNAFESAKNKASELAAATADANEKAKQLAETEARAAEESARARSAMLESYYQETLAKSGNALSPNSPVGSSQKLFSVGAQVSGALGAGGLGQGLAVAGGFTDALRELPKLKEAIGGLSPATLAAGAGVGALTVALDLYTRAQAAAKQAALSEIDARQRALTLLQTATKEEIAARILELQKQQEINKATAEDATKLFQGVKDDIQKELGPAAAAAEYYASAVGLAAGSYQAAKEAADKANDAVNKTSTELEILQKQSGLAANGITQIVNAAQNAAYIGSDLANRAAADLEAYKLVNDPKAGQDQLNQRIRDLQLESTVLANNIDIANSRADSLGRETEAGKAAAAEAAKLVDRYNTVGTSLEILSQEFVRTAVTAHDATAALEKIRSEQIATTAKYVEDTKNLEESKNQALYESTKKYNETLVNLADTAAKAAEDSLRKIQEKRADLAQSFGDSETDALRKARDKQLDDLEKYQQSEAKAARDHANDLVKIQRDQADKELDAVTNRDFKALYELQRNKQKELDAANETYNQAKADRAEAFAQQQNDAAEQFKREEEQRQVNYKRQLDQAQVAYNREVAQAQRNYNDAYQKAYTSYVNEQNILNAKYIAQQNQLNQSVTAQLQLQAQGDAAKLKLEQDYYVRSQQLIKGIYSNGGSTAAGGVGSGGRATATALATGGTATPGNDYRVNEPGSGGGESFSANGRSIDLPGFGVFRPSVGGTVSNNNNSKTVAVTINQSITGGRDEQRIAKIAAVEIRRAIVDLVS